MAIARLAGGCGSQVSSRRQNNDGIAIQCRRTGLAARCACATGSVGCDSGILGALQAGGPDTRHDPRFFRGQSGPHSRVAGREPPARFTGLSGVAGPARADCQHPQHGGADRWGRAHPALDGRRFVSGAGRESGAQTRCGLVRGSQGHQCHRHVDCAATARDRACRPALPEHQSVSDLFQHAHLQPQGHGGRGAGCDGRCTRLPPPHHGAGPHVGADHREPDFFADLPACHPAALSLAP